MESFKTAKFLQINDKTFNFSEVKTPGEALQYLLLADYLEAHSAGIIV